MAGQYHWLRPGVEEIIELHPDRRVSFQGGAPHGQWTYVWDEELQVGCLVVKFDCQAREGMVKTHTLIQLRGTASFKQKGGYVVMVKIDEPEPEPSS